MIIIMRPGATKDQIKQVEEKIISLGFKAHPIFGEIKTVIGAIGEKRLLDTPAITNMPGVEDIVPIMKPYKLACRVS